MILAMTNPEWCLVVAIMFFFAAAIVAWFVVATRPIWAALISVGLIFFALAFIIDP